MVRVFGVYPNDRVHQKLVTSLCAEYKASPKYADLSRDGKSKRDRVIKILHQRWGQFNVADIKSTHCQRLCDSFSAKPAAANRFAADMSAIFSSSIPRGYSDINPWRGVERLEGGEGYETWDTKALTYLISHGRERIVWVALMVLYTGQDRGDVLAMCDAEISGEIWERKRSKIKRKTGRNALRSVTLHPVAMGIVEDCREMKRQQGSIGPARPLLVNSRGQPWSSGYGASWRRELKRPTPLSYIAKT